MMIASRWFTRFLFGVAALALVACAETDANGKPPDPLGDFSLGFAVVVAKHAEKGPFSRDATPEELEAAVKSEIQRVFGPYDGDRLYHVAIAVNAYALAVPGIPLVASPKSALVITLNIWDDANQVKVGEEHKQFTILERISGKTLLGSGITQTKEEQLAGLARSAVRQVEKYMRENEALFVDPNAAETEPVDAATDS